MIYHDILVTIINSASWSVKPIRSKKNRKNGKKVGIHRYLGPGWDYKASQGD